MDTQEPMPAFDGSEIAIVGMAGRFPGANDLEQFWQNLRDGVESITMLSDQELLAAGVDPAELRDPHYVKAAPLLDDIESFDAAFFGYSPREAEIMDPQQRLFLETAWAALEHAGYDPATYADPIGVYAGAKTNTYLFTLAAHRELVKSIDFLQLILGGDLALLSTRISYKLDLKGPSYAVQTACSTSLVAIHLACQSLLIDECRMALAGAVALNVPHKAGYRYQEGGILSPDGHCRAFDAAANGTIFGSGVGVVVLKRLQDALDDGDTIHAVIRGSATNNDGSDKATFTAPSVEGQARVIIDALAVAGIEADTISYVESHGTGTALGDPIEILALSEAFAASTDQTQFCALGSVKTNVGHLDAAAGMSSLFKTVLALQHRAIPATLHFQTPNPRVDWAGSPFYVNGSLRPWDTDALPRRAGVSSFGFGGTNAHLILEEAPPQPSDPAARPWQLLVLSARSEAALDRATANLHAYLQRHPELHLADAAYTLQVGRRAFAHRRALVCRDRDDALAALAAGDPERVFDAVHERAAGPVSFMFPGQGAQYVGMGRGLYTDEPVFRAAVDRCAELLTPELGLDLRTVLYPPTGKEEGATAQLTQTALAQPALFVIEYALAELWQSWGIRPAALIGHSIGEYVAATLAGVWSLEGALQLVATRGRLMQQMPGGAMLAVPLPEAEILPLLHPEGTRELSLAAINGPAQCVVAGPVEAIDALAEQLAARGVQCRRLHTSHAFHSAMMEPLLPEFEAAVRRVRLSAPTLPLISNVSGTWLTAAQATDPAYWARQLRAPVRFAAGLQALLEQDRATGRPVLLEVGPGTTLSTFAQSAPAEPLALPSLRHPQDRRADGALLLTTFGRLWLAGVPVDWRALHGDEHRRRVPLPTYPFERQRFWIDVEPAAAPQRPPALAKTPDLADWFYLPTWQRADRPAATTEAARWLVFADDSSLSTQLVARLSEQGQAVVVRPGAGFARLDQHSYAIAPDSRADYRRLLEALKPPQRIIHLWSLDATAGVTDGASFEAAQERGFGSLLQLAQALGEQPAAEPIELVVVTNQAQPVAGAETLDPAQATLIGASLVIGQEYPQISCRSIDMALGAAADAALIDDLLAEISAASVDVQVAYRDGARWVPRFIPTRLEEPAGQPQLRERGVYLIAGGLGGIGLAVARDLAQRAQARLVLIGRSALPPRAEWAAWLEGHDDSDRTSRKLRALLELEALGAEVLPISADVADPEQMRAVVALTLAHWGALHGVIHVAGSARGAAFQAIRATGPDEIAAHFAPKVHGLLALHAALEGQDLDFCVVFSSLATVLGGLGNVAYAAANRFVDVFAHQQRREGKPWQSIDWDSWHQPDEQAGGVGATLVELALTPEEGVAALRRALAQDVPQLVVATSDLQARLDQWVRLEALRPGPTAGTPSAQPRTAPADRGELEQRIARIWQQVLGVGRVGLHDNFFDLGGNSLSGMQLVAELKRELGVAIAPVTLFEAPTVGALAKLLLPTSNGAQPHDERPKPRPAEDTAAPIAIIGLSGRFPGADDIAAFWHNLRAGVESITFFDDDELLAAGVPAAQLDDPSYVKARPILAGVEGFDAQFFGYSPREAELMDPQHRLFLECTWQALEHAGYAAHTERAAIGVFGGASLSTYLFNLYSNAELIQAVDPLQTIIGNAADSLTTSVSYKLNLKGPSLAVQTFCSTSLVAVHLACQSLQRGESDLALAGGVSIAVPQTSGYRHQADGIVSPDGHCRPFDAEAAGTLFGNGVGVVVLKRLDAAIRDGDTIHAVIRGTAINNDGALKVGYTAPSVDGQAQVIAAALEAAAVDPATIGYVEAHGTGTALGDPIEIAALTKAYRQWTDQQGYCAIGSVKSNVGHLDRAAGVAALIKAVLALKHGQIPPTLHYTAPNPRIDFASSPFYVNDTLSEWPRGNQPRRAGVSALGFGGTNAHVILEEAPEQPAPAPTRPWQLLLLSARTASALEAATADLQIYLRHAPADEFADAAYTLQTGRRRFSHRRALVCADRDDALAALEARDGRLLTAEQEQIERPVAFMFPGQGAQYVGMGRDLYESEPVFRAAVDRCAELLTPELDLDLRAILYPAAGEEEAATERLTRTALAQPALFSVAYALAELWQSWGIRPGVLIGHSIGEYVAATLAGVFELEDALRLVAARGRLMDELPGGAMLSVPLPEAEITPMLESELSLAAINAPALCVVAGPEAAIAALEQRLGERRVDTRRLHTSHAFHSPMMEPIVAPFTELVAGVELRAPTLRFVSCVTGDWITPEQATDPAYWGAQLRQPVRFADGLRTLLGDADAERAPVLLEVGAGQTLASLARRQIGAEQERMVLASLRHPHESQPDLRVLLTTLARLWLAGVAIDWQGFAAHEQRRRIPLPTYPFERQRFWIEPGDGAATLTPQSSRKPPVATWFYSPSWRRSRLPEATAAADSGPQRWLIFGDACGLSAQLAERLQRAGHRATIVMPGASFGAINDRRYTLDPRAPGDYDTLLRRLAADGLPDGIIHCWSVTAERAAPTPASFEAAQDRGFYSLIFLAQALSRQQLPTRLPLWVVATGLHEVSGEEQLQPEQATLLGACKTLPHEQPRLACRSLDVVIAPGRIGQLADQILAEIAADASDTVVAYRGAHRWVPTVERITVDETRPPRLREQGAYLISGGLSAQGYAFTEQLAQTAQAKLLLLDRAGLPPRDEWARWLLPEQPLDLAAPEVAALHPAGRWTLDLAAEQDAIRGLEQRLTPGLAVPPPGLEAAVDQLCASYIYRYFAANIDTSRGQSYDRAALAHTLRILPKFDKFFAFLLAVLAEEQIIQIDGERIVFVQRPDQLPDPALLRRELEQHYPGSSESFWALEHCATHYTAALSGDEEAISVLYPDGSSAMLLAVTESQDQYSNTAVYRRVMADLIRRAAAEAGGRTLKILEIGAGDGKLTWDLVEELRGTPIEYHFTDIGKSFVLSAEKQAAERDLAFMRFGVLDASQPPEPQGYAQYDFDVILALDVIHATPRIAETLDSLQRLLAPGGALLVLEPTRPQRWVTMIWGLAEGWWYFADEDLRQLGPLLRPEQWEQVLARQPLVNTAVYPRGDARTAADHSLLVAQQPRTINTAAYRDWLQERLRAERAAIESKIMQVHALEAQGAEVLVAAVDATNVDDLRGAIAEAESRFGPLRGVIHAATPEAGSALSALSPAACAAAFRASAYAPLALGAALHGKALDFALLSGSLSGLSGGAGAALPAASSLFLDALATASQADGGVRWSSIAWEPWQRRPGSAPADATLTPDEAARAIQRLLALDLRGPAIVSPRDVTALIGQWQTLPEPQAADLDGAADGARHLRPQLQSAYVAPGSELEQQLAQIWSEVLGVREIGIHDNFFELGGDSLMATQLGSRLRDTFQVDLPLRKFFEAPTITGLTLLIAERQAAQEEQEKLEILRMLEQLSEDEIQAEIARRNLASSR